MAVAAALVSAPPTTRKRRLTVAKSKPVIPSLPVATPVAVIAQPVTPTAKLAPTVAPPFVPAPSASIEEETQQFSFGQEVSFGQEAVDVAESEAPTDGDLFSLFGGGSEVNSSEETVTQPETASLADSSEQTSTALPLQVTQPVADVEPTTEEFDHSFVSPVSSADSTPAKRPRSPTTLPQWKQPKNLGAAAAVIIALGAVGFWLMGPDAKNGVTTKSSKKSGSTVTKSTGTSTKKTDAHEVTVRVGHSSEFSNIGRAVQSILENRSEHEASAGGKPLRFIISVTPGQPFEEALVLDESFPGELHLKSENSNRVKLVPSGNDPVISIKNLSNVTIENFSIDLSGFPPKDTGIAISGSASRCQIKQTIISGAGKASIVLAGAKGGSGADAILFDGVTIQNSSPTAFGIHIAKGDASQNVTLQRCRFIGSLSAAMSAEGAIDALTLRNCAISGGQSSSTNGLSFGAGVVVKNLLIERCSFTNLGGSAILFEDMPAGGSDNLSWRNNLFAGVKGAELLIKKNYDAKKFEALISQEKPIANNWCDRPAAKPIPGEHDLLGEGGLRIASIEFASTDPKADIYLMPKPNAPYKTAGIAKPSK